MTHGGSHTGGCLSAAASTAGVQNETALHCIKSVQVEAYLDSLLVVEHPT